MDSKREHYLSMPEFLVAYNGLNMGIHLGNVTCDPRLDCSTYLESLGVGFLNYPEANPSNGRYYPETDEQRYSLYHSRVRYANDFIELGSRFSDKMPGIVSLAEEFEDDICPDVMHQRMFKNAIYIGVGAIFLTWQSVQESIVDSQIAAILENKDFDWDADLKRLNNQIN
jgi:hypothetical protein